MIHIHCPTARNIFHTTLTAAALALVATMSLATPRAALAQEVPFDALAIESDVPLRAGAGKVYYQVGSLKKNQTVRVEQVIFGWHKIRPPKGVFSYVGKSNIKLSEDGVKGTVTKDRVEVYAAAVTGPDASYRGQTLLNEGDAVDILGSDGSFYKISPPADAFVYVAPGALRRVDAMAQQMQAARQSDGDNPINTDTATTDTGDTATNATTDTGNNQTTDSGDADTGDTGTTDTGDTATNKTTDTGNNQTTDTGDADTGDTDTGDTGTADAGDTDTDMGNNSSLLDTGGKAGDAAADTDVQGITETVAQVDAKLLPLFDEPVEDQPIDEMLAAYEALQEGRLLGPADAQLVAVRIAALKRNKQVAEAIAKIKQARAAAEQTQIDTTEPDQTPPPVDPSQYDAVGKLLASSIYNGTNLPRMFRLIDPTTGRTLAYVHPNDPIKPKRMLGQVVGLKGDKRFDSGLKLQIIDVKQAYVLSSTE